VTAETLTSQKESLPEHEGRRRRRKEERFEDEKPHEKSFQGEWFNA